MEYFSENIALNNLCVDWSKLVTNQAKQEIGRFVKASSGYHGLELANSLRAYVKKRNGEPYAVSFKFKRYGVFFQKDVGRGRPISNTNRRPRPWFDNPVNDNIDKLVSGITDNFHDRIVNTSRILIK